MAMTTACHLHSGVGGGRLSRVIPASEFASRAAELYSSGLESGVLRHLLPDCRIIKQQQRHDAGGEQSLD